MANKRRAKVCDQLFSLIEVFVAAGGRGMDERGRDNREIRSIQLPDRNYSLSRERSPLLQWLLSYIINIVRIQFILTKEI